MRIYTIDYRTFSVFLIVNTVWFPLERCTDHDSPRRKKCFVFLFSSFSVHLIFIFIFIFSPNVAKLSV